MAEPSFFSRFSISSPNRYVLYLSGLSFLLSLIFPIYGFEPSQVQKGALVFIVIGLLNWLFESIQMRRFSILEHECREEDDVPDKVKEEIIVWTIFEYIILIGSYGMGLLIVFG